MVTDNETINQLMGFESRIFETIRNLPLPSLTDKGDERIICAYDKFAQELCVLLPKRNEIQCAQSNCKINVTSKNRRLLNKKYPDGVFMGIQRDGALSSVRLFGIFDKTELSTVTQQLEEFVPVRDRPEVSEFQFSHGYPDPPKRCRYMPWVKECGQYLTSPKWKYSILNGWKRHTPTWNYSFWKGWRKK